MAKKSNNVDKKDKTSILEWITSKEKIILGVAGALVAIHPILDFVYNLYYQLECENFYSIPGEYFHSSIDDKLVYLTCILILIVLCTVPFIVRKYDEKKQIQTKGTTAYFSLVAIVLGLLIGIFNVCNLVEIMKRTYKTFDWVRNINDFLNKNATITVTIVIAAGIITWLTITLIDKIGAIKRSLIKNVIIVVFCLSFTTTILLIIYGVFFKLSISIENKTKYEFVTIDEEEYVILSEDDDKYLVVLYDVNENGQYIFDTSKYWFYEKHQGSYQYIDLKDCPKINTGEVDAYD